MAALGLPLGEAASLETILAFAREHLLRERTAPQTGILILDRCLLDLSAYAAVLGFSQTVLGLLDELMLVSLRQMSAVFYVPIAGENMETRTIHEDTPFRHRVAVEILQIAARLALPLHEVPAAYPARLPAVLKRLAAEIGPS